jgi:arginyl-tRNA synthetase
MSTDYADFQARVLCAARTHGVSAREWAEEICRKVEEVEEVEEVKEVKEVKTKKLLRLP